MKIVVLDAATLGDDLDLSVLREFGEVTVYPSTTAEQLPARIGEAEVIVVNKTRCDADTCRYAPRLRLICEAATGYDNIDLAYCRAHGIAVCNVVGYSSHSVAQVTAAMALSLYTHLSAYDRHTKSGAYTAAGVPNCLVPVYHEMAGRTWGIYGYGNIGKQVAKIAEALGCRVLICKNTPVDDYPCVTPDELCEASDILSLHTPLTEQTRGAISAERLAKMRPGSILINVARGAVVDENAVTEAVLSGRLGGYGCDVYAGEPLAADHPYRKLFGLEQVILTPHMAWGSYESRSRCLFEICENIRSFTRGQQRNRVDLSAVRV